MPEQVLIQRGRSTKAAVVDAQNDIPSAASLDSRLDRQAAAEKASETLAAAVAMRTTVISITPGIDQLLLAATKLPKSLSTTQNNELDDISPSSLFDAMVRLQRYAPSLTMTRD